MKLSKIKELGVCIFVLLLWSSIVHSAPIKYLALDLDETIIQREQEYILDKGELKPALQEIRISAPYPDGSIQNRTYYIRAGAMTFLNYLTQEKAKGNLEFGFLSLSHQARLNAVLSAITINKRPLIHIVGAAFGSEMIESFNRANGFTGSLRLKDLRIMTHPAALQYWLGLKKNDSSVLNQVTEFKNDPPSRVVLVDDSPQNTHEAQRSQVIKAIYNKKSADYWKAYNHYAQNPLPKASESFETEKFMGRHSSEALQYKTLRWLMEYAKTEALPNDYAEWDKLLNTPESLASEKSLFKYLIPGILAKDSANTDILILGRDGDLFYKAMQSLRHALGIKSKISYAEISRPVAGNHSREELTEVLKKAGVDTDAVKNGTRQLRIIDTGYEGSVPKQIIKALVDENDWQRKVKNISAFLFSTFTAGGKDVSHYSSFNHYLMNGGFIERNDHLFRLGSEQTREIIYYWEHKRPRQFVRPLDIANGEVQLGKSHPTATRYSYMLHWHVNDYFQKPEVAALLKERTQFEMGIHGNYPASWAKDTVDFSKLNSPEFAETDGLKTIRAKMVYFETQGKVNPLATGTDGNEEWVKNQHRIRDNAMAKYYDSKKEPEFIHHTQSRTNHRDAWFEYDPKFLTETNELRSSPETHEKLDLKAAWNRRKLSMMHLSRSAAGKHKMGATKDLTVYGDQLSAATVASQEKVNSIILANLRTSFDKPEQLDAFVRDIAEAYLGKIKSEKNPLFRDWNYQHGPLGDQSFERASEVAKNWHWFITWFQSELKKPYNPLILSSQVHYLLATKIHPFYDAVGKTSRDLTDFIFMRKGLMPPDWTKLDYNEYMKQTTSLKSTQELLLKASVQSVTAPICRQIFL
ncbi:NLI interacting factor-like phosphatase [compost metagenome]